MTISAQASQVMRGLALDEDRKWRIPADPVLGPIVHKEYAVFGTEWWLYVCNRIAEDPQRLLQALVDAAA